MMTPESMVSDVALSYSRQPTAWLSGHELARARNQVCDKDALQQKGAPTCRRLFLVSGQQQQRQMIVAGTLRLTSSVWKSAVSNERRLLVLCCLFVGIAFPAAVNLAAGADPPPEPAASIPVSDRQWLTDYPVRASDPDQQTTLRAGFIPEPDRPVWGQPLAVNLTVVNIGDADFEFMFGGDYRGTGRHNRIKIRITDVHGNELNDPLANRPDLGGLSTFEVITSRGQPFHRNIDLNQFRSIPGPGKYRVACEFAFDEPYSDRKDFPKPVIRSEFDLTIRPRREDNIHQVLSDLQKRTDASPPEKLPELMRRIAEFGNEHALPLMQTYLASDSSPHQIAACSALPLIPGGKSLQTAVEALHSENTLLRTAAAGALGQYPDAEGVEALLLALSQHEQESPFRNALLCALGATKSGRAVPVLEQSLTGATQDRFAAVEGLAQMGGPQATAILRRHADVDDLALRLRIVQALATSLREPIEPEWLLPIMMCRRHNSREWLDSLSMVRIWCGPDALPALLSVVDYEVPWSHRNFWVLHHAAAAKGAPKFAYEYDPNSQGTPEQHRQNRELLARLKTLAGPIPEQHFWPEPPIIELKTHPPIDFSVHLSTLKGKGETKATVVCGFFRETWDRNGGSSSFHPTGPHASTYQVANDVRAILSSAARAKESGLTARQIAALRELSLPAKAPVIKEGLTLLYIWWQESPPGHVRSRARIRLQNAVQRAVQQYHTDHVAFAAAAGKIMAAESHTPGQ